MAYLAPLDGIRAIAIIAVLIFHISPSAISGGFTGVDVFFVLSGFLITSVLLHDLCEGRFSIREFYLRRIQRLLPNAIVMVLAVQVLWTLFTPPGMACSAGKHGLWALFNLSNFYTWKYLQGYWGKSAESAPLTHTWSLGIEEQFYLFFPCILLILVRFRPNQVRTFLVIAMVVSFGICLYGTYTRPVATFYLLPTRGWELLLGSVLAAYRTSLDFPANSLCSSITPTMRTVIGWSGIALIVSGFFVIDEESHFPGWVSLLPTVGTAILLISVIDGETRLSRLLSSPFMVGTGKLSYSIYLWHWPLITLGKFQANLNGLPQFSGALAGGLAGIILGCIAYVCVEQPLRNRGAGRSWRLVTISIGFLLASLYSGFVASRGRVIDSSDRFDRVSTKATLFDVGLDPNTSLSTSEQYYDVDLPPTPPLPKVPSWQTGGIIHRYGDSRPQVVVLGSSHAMMYSRLIDDICHEMGISIAFLCTGNGTPVFFESQFTPSFSTPLEAREFDEARKRWLREWRPECVFVIDRWDFRCNRSPEDFERRLRSFLREVSPLAEQIVVVSQIPVLICGGSGNLRELINWRIGSGYGLPSIAADSNEYRRKQVVVKADALTKEFQNLRVLRADLSFLQGGGFVRYAEGRSFYYTDDNHLSDVGTEVVRTLFQTAITEAHLAASSR